MKSKSSKANKLYLPAPRPNLPVRGRTQTGTFYVYAIACEGNSYYIGHTDDLRKRWNEHVSGAGADWTKRYKPVHVAHYEEYESRKEAIAREKELKTGFGRKWLKSRDKSWSGAAGRRPHPGGD